MQCCMGMDSDVGAWRHENKAKEREEGVVLTAAEARLKMYEEACWLQPPATRGGHDPRLELS